MVQREKFPNYSWALFGIIIATGLLYFAMQSLMTYSLKFVTSAMSAVLIYVAIPISYILDYLFFAKKFGAEELCGVALIIITNVVLGFLKGTGRIS